MYIGLLESILFKTKYGNVVQEFLDGKAREGRKQSRSSEMHTTILIVFL
jgi:hypothetical protein